MTTLNTIIEEEKNKFEKELGVFLMPMKNMEGREWSDKVFPCEGGYCTTDVQDIEDFLTTAMQRAYEQALDDVAGGIQLFIIPNSSSRDSNLHAEGNNACRKNILANLDQLKKELDQNKK